MADYNLEHLAVLLVDDSRHIRSLVKSVLHSLGVRGVLEAADGAAAFEVLKTMPVDVVLCDWNMDPLDGLDFTRLVRTAEDSPNPFLPIILLTGHSELRHVMEARDCGVNEFLAKPISATAVYGRIRAVIEQPRNFVRTNRFFGPDRRRQQSDKIPGPEQRTPGQAEFVDAPPPRKLGPGRPAT